MVKCGSPCKCDGRQCLLLPSFKEVAYESESVSHRDIPAAVDADFNTGIGDALRADGVGMGPDESKNEQKCDWNYVWSEIV
mmetsp:Transcript_28375/g.83480  ORF Transcript_28375/g.83480 Transcript_28375/m.83480 type:complete len:81 (-) Transcript_28375:596-838(-)